MTRTERSCAECRYKKCIAVGMSMNRSQYGRHTQKQSSNTSYAPNLTEPLRDMITSIKQKCLDQKLSLSDLAHLIADFYINGLKLLSSNNESINNDLIDELSMLQNVSANSLNSSPTNSQSLSQISAMIKSNSAQHCNPQPQSSVLLPRSIAILFCVLFDLTIKFNNENDSDAQHCLNDFKHFVHFVQETVLTRQNQLTDLLKIGLFFKCIRTLLERVPKNDDQFDKKITDLMRSEISLFKFEDLNSSSSTQMNNLKANQSVFNLGILFSNLNCLLYKHLCSEELDTLINKNVY
jgi:hypothetical protein